MSESDKPDLGQPSSYLTLQKGAPVYSCDGKSLGNVEEVLADAEIDIFDGVILDTSVLPGGHRFVDADQVEECFDTGPAAEAGRRRGREPARARRQPGRDGGRPDRRARLEARAAPAPRLGAALGQGAEGLGGLLG